MAYQISIVVCTHNRAYHLERLLQCLGAQVAARQLYEIIIVDNSSTDESAQVAQRGHRSLSNLRCVYEDRIGLAHARNRGLREAAGEYIAYVDDDCELPDQWVAVALETIQSLAPAVFTGPVYPLYNVPRPVWFKDEYGSITFGNAARSLGEKEFPVGGNFVIRRDILQMVGGFDVHLGMSGRKLGYGEETAVVRRLRMVAPSSVVYYVPLLYVNHLVRPEKMTWPWIIRWRITLGRSHYRWLLSDAQAPSLPRLCLWAARGLCHLVVSATWGLAHRDRQQCPRLQHHLYENALPHLTTLGVLAEAVAERLAGWRRPGRRGAKRPA